MRRVLIVDDEPDVVATLTMLLEQDYVVESAGNGANAVARLEHDRFDAIVLDLLMPEMDGFAVLAELERRAIAVPVLVLSAMADVHPKLGRLRVDGVCIKPCDPEELLAKLDRILEPAGSLSSPRGS